MLARSRHRTRLFHEEEFSKLQVDTPGGGLNSLTWSAKLINLEYGYLRYLCKGFLEIYTHFINTQYNLQSRAVGH